MSSRGATLIHSGHSLSVRSICSKAYTTSRESAHNGAKKSWRCWTISPFRCQKQLRLSIKTSCNQGTWDVVVISFCGGTDAVLECRQVPTVQFLIGRDVELQTIVDQIKSSIGSTAPGHVAILGGGGMGKSTLALAVLHHPEVVALFEKHRYFISCETVESPGGLIAEIASHVGIVGDQLRKSLLRRPQKASTHYRAGQL